MNGCSTSEIKDAQRTQEPCLGPDHVCEGLIDKGAPELGKIESDLVFGAGVTDGLDT
jgi:hypothetical protein